MTLTHGNGGYSSGCRCQQCTQAHADYRRELRARRDPADAPHGTVSGYNNWSCRCDDCRAAATRYKSRYYLAAVPDTEPDDDQPPPKPQWHTDAACRGCDADLWYPERGQTVDHAKAICAGCPVRVQCLNHALDNDERLGVWGGLSAKERSRIRRARAIGQPKPIRQTVRRTG